MKKNFSLFILFVFINLFSMYAQRGKDGVKVVSAANTIVNDFTSLAADALAGSTNITVANSVALSSGDLVMIIQMQGATIKGGVNDNTWGEVTNYNNCGLYEFKEVFSVTGPSTVNFTCPLINNYTASGRTQVVRVPRYTSLTINNGGVLTTTNWNGTIGGILAVEVLYNTLINNGGSADVTGKGFRGGNIDSLTNLNTTNFVSANKADGGEKGEGIAGYENDYDAIGGRYCRGAAANGGGGGTAHNSGGGGGANTGSITVWTGNGTPDISNPAWISGWNLESPGFANSFSSGGGRGGYSFSANEQDALTVAPGNGSWGGDMRRIVGGLGGRPLAYNTGRLFLGGGGGAGDGNDFCNAPGSSGGGMAYFISYGIIGGAGQIMANGKKGSNTIGIGIDAPGGGGGGGTVILNSIGAINGISILAEGGQGGDQFLTASEAEGPGGGGGGGYISISNGSITAQTFGGSNGTTNSPSLTEFPPNGATKGTNGLESTNVFDFTFQVKNDTICSGATSVLTVKTNGTVP
ncbi:MAG: hypothetical protein H0W84_05815, partial [Bacteroidetes bacterium]|nr:hypothetical protein [Bacteroidota bacterium]